LVDEHIDISVEASEIDHAIARLDEALAKKEQLTGQVLPAVEATTTQAKRAVSKQPVPRLDAFYSNAIGDLGRQTENVKQQATNLITNEAPKIKGLEQSAKRIASMLPGLREANRLQTALKSLSAGNIAGVIGILMLALSIYRQVASMMEEQKRQQEEYKRSVMEIRGFTTSAQFEAWQKQQRHLQEAYRSGIIP
jgi:hypothetical protein